MKKLPFFFLWLLTFLIFLCFSAVTPALLDKAFYACLPLSFLIRFANFMEVSSFQIIMLPLGFASFVFWACRLSKLHSSLRKKLLTLHPFRAACYIGFSQGIVCGLVNYLAILVPCLLAILCMMAQ